MDGIAGAVSVPGAVPVAIALGSNLGAREALLHEAVRALQPYVRNTRLSSLHETAYVGAASAPQPPYLNAVLVGVTDLPAPALLRRLLKTERDLGRTRPFQDAPRTIDLDLILYGASVLDEPGLIVPHPRFRERRFVLAPLAEIAGDWVDPVSQRTIAELLRALA